jgi:uncharacterized protein
MGTVGWLLLVAAALALGFSVGRLWPGSAAKMTELQRERDAAREDLQSYRDDVSGHFERTAELFDKVTADYRGLYEHLALSARQLGAIRGEAIKAPRADPEQRRLAGTPAAAPSPLSGQAATAPPPEAPPREAPPQTGAPLPPDVPLPPDAPMPRDAPMPPDGPMPPEASPPEGIAQPAGQGPADGAPPKPRTADPG